MVCIYAIASVKKGCGDAFLKIAESLIHHSRAEAGNISYHLAKEADGSYVFMELWRDNAAVALHMKAEHFVGAGKKLEAVLTKPLEIHVMQGVL